MQINISDLIDNMAQDYGADTIGLEDPGITDAERILALANGRNPDHDLPAPIPVRAGKKRPARRLGRTLLIAAVIILALTVTALAVYQYGLRDTELAQVSLTYERDEDGEQVLTTKTTSALSLNGFSDSAEYQAYQEWTAWNEAWIAENWDIYTELGVDDSYHETPDNYATYYSASFQEQADKLDEIAEKYGLTLHTDLELVYTEGQLCGALGIDDFLPDGVEAKGGYYYEDGSFHLECTTVIDGAETWITCNNNVTGSFALIFMSMPKEYEEWSYTASGGTELIMVQTPSSSFMVAGLEGSYLIVTVDAVLDAGELEALAEEIDLTALNDCFATEEARAEIRERVAAYTEAQATATTTDNGDDTAAEAIAYLGDWYLTETEDAGTLYQITSRVPSYASDYYSVVRYYDGAVTELGYRELAFADQCTQEERLSLETYSDIYLAGTAYDDTAQVETCTVSGYEAVAVIREDVNFEYGSIHLYWVDTERQLLFRLNTCGLPLATALTIAESVDGTAPAEAPARETPSEEEALAQRVMDIGDVRFYNLDAVTTGLQSQNVLADIGGFELTDLPEGFYFANSWTYYMEQKYTDEIDYCLTRMIKSYATAEDEEMRINLSYRRYYTLDGSEPLDMETAFALRMDDAWFDVELTACTVNGYEGYYVDYDMEVSHSFSLTWADTDREIIFTITVDYDRTENIHTYTMEEMLTLADSLVEETQTQTVIINADTSTTDLQSQNVLADTGGFGLTDLPEGFSLTGGGSYDKMQMHSDEIDFCVTDVTKIYSDGSLDLRTVLLDWRSYYTQDGSQKLDMETAFALYKKWYADGELTDCTVSGYEGYYRWDEFSRQVSLCWADTDRGLVFAVTMNYDEGDDPADYSLEALLAMADSIVEEDSSYVTSSVDFSDVMREEAGQFDTYVVSGLTTAPALGYALSTDDGYTSGDLVWSTEEQTYDEMCVLYDNGLALIYSRFWTDEDKTATANADAFQAMQEYLLACDTEGTAVATGLTVGGNAAYTVDYGTRRELTWYDADEDVIFTLVQIYEYADETLDTQQLMALGESVTKE